jgi:hypothetical protein
MTLKKNREEIESENLDFVVDDDYHARQTNVLRGFFFLFLKNLLLFDHPSKKCSIVHRTR